VENSPIALVFNSGDQLKYSGGGLRFANAASIYCHTLFISQAMVVNIQAVLVEY